MSRMWPLSGGVADCRQRGRRLPWAGGVAGILLSTVSLVITFLAKVCLYLSFFKDFFSLWCKPFPAILYAKCGAKSFTVEPFVWSLLLVPFSEDEETGPQRH